MFNLKLQFFKLRKILDLFKNQAPTAIIEENVNSVENYKAESADEYNRAKRYLGENNNSFKSFHVSVDSAKDFLCLLNLLGAIHANFNIRSKPFIIEGEENSKSLKKGMIKPDLIKHSFSSVYPNHKWYSDVTEFKQKTRH